MRGALKARAERYEADRDLALMTAYLTANLTQADWKKMPDFQKWRRQMTEGPAHTSDAEIIARFEAWSKAGLDVTAH